MPPSTRQHYLPASVIGGFGLARSSALREALVAVRRKGSLEVTMATAESVAYERGLYTLQNPPPGINADDLDNLWTQSLEPPVPGAIERLAARMASSADEAAILAYVASLGVRHPAYFRRIAQQHATAAGLPPPNRDVLQFLRVAGLKNAVPQVSNLRWRVLEPRPDGPRFILGDMGFSIITEQGVGENGLLVPLGPWLALLGFRDRQSRIGFVDRRSPTAMTVGWLNAAAWEEDDLRDAYTHPDDAEALLALRPTAETRVNLRGGPYLGWGAAHTLFGDPS